MKKKYKILCIIAGFAMLIATALYNGLVVRRYTIETNKESARIVLLSDLHSTIYGKDQQPLIKKIKDLNPDLILLAGDIADDNVPIEGTILLLSVIQGFAPVYYVTGNHEYWSGDIGTILNEIQSYGVVILSDVYEKIEINGNIIIIAGIEDPDKRDYQMPGYNQEKVMEEVFNEIDTEAVFKILIAHRPENIDFYKKFTFNLVVSGHAHGGQIRIPFILNGLFAPNQGFFPKYAGGLYRHEKLFHVVSRGLSINPILPRIFNPPEIVLIELKAAIAEK